MPRERGRPATRAPGTSKEAAFAAAHLPGAPRRLRGRSSGLKGAPAARRPRRWAQAPTLDPGDLGGPWVRKSGQAQGLPLARRAARRPAVAGGCGYPDARELNWRSIVRRRGRITQMQARAPGPVASSQQSHLAKLRHTKPGVHETRDAPHRSLPRSPGTPRTAGPRTSHRPRQTAQPLSGQAGRPPSQRRNRGHKYVPLPVPSAEKESVSRDWTQRPSGPGAPGRQSPTLRQNKGPRQPGPGRWTIPHPRRLARQRRQQPPSPERLTARPYAGHRGSPPAMCPEPLTPGCPSPPEGARRTS